MLCNAIDPSETECLFHSIVVTDADLTGILKRECEPDVFFGLEVILQPFTPFQSVAGIEDLFAVRLEEHDWCNESNCKKSVARRRMYR
jgi:hypothetical protein